MTSIIWQRAYQPSTQTTGFEAEVLKRLDALEKSKTQNLDLIAKRSLLLGPRESNPSASDGPDDYPEGLTIDTLSGATGWPIATGLVETWRYFDIRAYQIVRPKQAGPSYERFWASTTTWDNWQLAATVQRSAATSTDFNPTGTGDETAVTNTITDFPSSNFEASVAVQIQAYHENTTTTSVNWTALAQISLDGGSTFNSGKRQFGEGGGAGETRQQPINVHHTYGGSVTGDIVVRLRVSSDDSSNSKFDEFEITVDIGNDY